METFQILCQLLYLYRDLKTTVIEVEIALSKKTSLLRRLQAQTLPNEAPLIGIIHPFSKMADPLNIARTADS